MWQEKPIPPELKNETIESRLIKTEKNVSELRAEMSELREKYLELAEEILESHKWFTERYSSLLSNALKHDIITREMIRSIPDINYIVAKTVKKAGEILWMQNTV